MDKKTRTPSSSNKNRQKSGIATPKMVITPVAKKATNTGNRSTKRKKISKNILEESTAEVLLSQSDESGRVASTPIATTGAARKKMKTPKSGKKQDKKDKSKITEDVQDDILSVEDEDHDDSLVITFPKIQTSTPKIQNLDTTEDLEATVEAGVVKRTKMAKITKQKRKSVGKKAVEPTDKASQSLEKKNVKEVAPVSRKRKIATVTVEEGSVEIKDSGKMESQVTEKSAAVKPNRESEGKLATQFGKKSKDGGKTRKRLAAESEANKAAETGAAESEGNKAGETGAAESEGNKAGETGASESEANKAGETGDSKKQKLDKYRVYCGNLPRGVTKETLYFFIGENNVFPEVRLVKLHKLSHGNKKRRMRVHHAILTCKTWEDAECIVSLNQISMPSPTLKEESQLDIHHVRNDETNDCKLYVGDLTEDTEEAHLETFFKGHDLCPDRVIVIRRKKKKLSKGYGFVWFASVSEAERAVKLNGSQVNDQAVRLECLKKKDDHVLDQETD